MKYNIRSKGRFTKHYALHTLLSIGGTNWTRIFFILFFGVFFLFAQEPDPIEYAQAEALPPIATATPVMIEVKIDWTRERINKEIEIKAAEYGKNAETLKKIVACESGYDVDIQSHHVRNGVREQSYGLAQIHLPDHPTVSYEEAIDPAFAIDFLAKNYGKVSWSCSKMI